MKRFLIAFWKMLRSNLVLKIMSLVFAVILWSYVLGVENPLREHTINDIPVTCDSMEDLRANGLAIAGSIPDILGTVNIRVRLNQNDLSSLKEESLSAKIDLSNIVDSDTYTLDITPYSTVGQAISVYPSKVTLTVEKYKTRLIPVEVRTEGSVPAGYYAGTPEITPNAINISGAESDVKKVASALCTVNLDGVTESYKKSMEVMLLDADGNEVDSRIFYEDLPSVFVTQSVLPKKVVTVDAQGAIIGQDSLAPGFEITDIESDPKSVTIVGDKGLIDGITSIDLVPYSVSEADGDIVALLDYAPPEGVSVLDSEKAKVVITIREVTDTKEYEDVDIELRNTGSGLTASADPDTTGVTVIAGTSKISKLTRSDIIPYVDLEGFEPGEYSLNVQFEIPEGFEAENFTPDIATVKVTIRKK